MTANKRALPPTFKSNLAKLDEHAVQASEYEELPELTDEMLARAVVNRGGRPRSDNPRKLITLRLPADVIDRWRATGPGWQTRMADRLSPGPVTGRKGP
ncbi:MAG: BrnA antitoxin family protein [Aquincola sp.]|uniref:BrnA antitoxin family protein n=1 Tax=uncultured Aquincola sp. TaxID=886556 RepID=UPI0032B182C8|nr:BrnA antitoxin family protein [Aquincola sp.]